MPNWLGLVCLTSDKSISFRTVQKTRFDKLGILAQYSVLYDIYSHNKKVLKRALEYCVQSGIKMYRISSEMFPFSDTAVGRQVFKESTIALDNIGKYAIQNGIRITCHPAQFVTLVSESTSSIRNSVDSLLAHATVLDYMGLPENYWCPIIIHGGKKDNSTRLVDSIHRLPSNIANRLVLENDEYSYSVDSLFALQQFVKIPIVFDVHHHLIMNKLGDYDDVSHLLALETCRSTWPDPNAQVVHLSNGREGLHDRSHSDFITKMPSCFLSDRGLWIEVEAKAKERVIFSLREVYPGVLS